MRWFTIGTFVLCLFIFCVKCQNNAEYVQLNIYIELDVKTKAKAELINLEIVSQIPENTIFFYEGAIPHITLYQTSFNVEYLTLLKER